MTLGELKSHIEDLLKTGVSENTPLKIRDRDDYRFHDMNIAFEQIFINEKDKLSTEGEKVLTCMWITE